MLMTVIKTIDDLMNEHIDFTNLSVKLNADPYDLISKYNDIYKVVATKYHHMPYFHKAIVDETRARMKQWIKANYPKECAPTHKRVEGVHGCYEGE